MFFNILKYLCLVLCMANFLNFVKSNEIQVSCKDEQGKSVDWFYLYKFPAHYHVDGSGHFDNSGLSYMYLTSQSFDNWSLSENKINHTTSMAAVTLEPLYADTSVLLLAYNDEFPNGSVIATGGHTKGVIATDGYTGIWLIHSVPKFPTIPKYTYPATGTYYGQSFLCITLNGTDMDKVGELLVFNEPNIYYERIPSALSEKYPHLELVIQKKWIHLAPFSHVLDLKSLQGTVFKSFAKSSKFNKELYEDFVAPTLDTNLLVETWRNGGGNFQSNCSLKDKVYNIKAIEVPQLKLNFSSTLDHSKWAVSQSIGLKFWRWRLTASANWICVGDINRQHHQLFRGGGVVCQQNKLLAKLFRKLVKNYEMCS